MRNQSILVAIGAALALAACTYVERTPQPTVVQTPPTVVAPAPTAPPTVTVRPGY
jgi:hypothetical protein